MTINTHTINLSGSCFESELTYLAGQWHHPMNIKDGGVSIKKRFGWSSLFSEELSKAYGDSRRFYFYFSEMEDGEHEAITRMRFIESPNFKKYLQVWTATAPEEIADSEIFLTMLVEMTRGGMKNQRAKIAKRGLREATGDEDYRLGVDAWDSKGRGYQIKSERTIALMERSGELQKAKVKVI